MIAGAGVCGCRLAARLQRLGLDVVLLERSRFGLSGPHWTNGVDPVALANAAGFVPSGREVHRPGGRIVMLSPSAGLRVELDSSPLVELDMRQFMRRLRAECEGVRVFEMATLEHADFTEHGGVEIGFSAGPIGTARRKSVKLRAALAVDCTGSRQALAEMHPLRQKLWPPFPPGLTCRATQQVRRVKDPEGAKRFCDELEVEPSTTVMFSGPWGGWSILNVTVDPSFETVELLAGTLCREGLSGGAGPVRDFLRRQRWIGKALRAGSGRILLGPPYGRLFDGGLVLAGESAGHVFPLHGSGVVSSLKAANFLAEEIEKARDLHDPELLRRYAARCAKEFAGFALSSRLVRLLDEIGREGVERIFEAGIMTPRVLRAGLLQKPPFPLRAELAGAAKLVLSAPHLSGRLLSAAVAGASDVLRTLLHNRHLRFVKT